MRLSALTLTSRDLVRSRVFYTAKLGFTLLEERDGQMFVVDAGGVKLHVDRDGMRAPLDAAEPRLLFRTRELSRRCLALRDAGVSVEGPRDGMARLSDPDGHPIILMENNQ
jgi:catechol 2,3-dioxygenase-like lactoylglutathione lyase family enzyme